jgi:hypothetical protein
LSDLKVEIAWTSLAFAASPVWVNESTRCRAVQQATRGASVDAGEIEPGALTLIMSNGDRRFEPYYTGSPLSPYVQPGKRVRISQGSNVVWNGYIDTISPAYPAGGKDAICTIGCIDLAGKAARTPAPNLYKDAVLTLGASHFYRTDEILWEGTAPPVYGVAADSSGNGLNGQYIGANIGAIEYGVQGPSPVAKGFTVANSPPAQLAYLQSFAYAHSTGDGSLAFWIRTTTTANQIVAYQDSGGAFPHLAVQIRGTDGKIDVQRSDGTIFTSTNTVPINDGSWSLIVLIKAGANLNIFINGVAHGITPWPVPLLNTGFSPNFGRLQGVTISNISIFQADIGAPGVHTLWSAMRGLHYNEMESRFDFLLSETGFPSGYRAFFEIPDLLPLDYDEKTTTLLQALQQLSESEGVPLVVHLGNEFGQYPRNLGFGGHPQSSLVQMTLSVGDYQELRLLSDAQDYASSVRVQQINHGAWAEAFTGADPNGFRQVQITTVVGVSQAELQAYANWEAACREPDRLRIGELLVFQTASVDTSTLDLLDRIVVEWQPPGGGAPISEETLIVGMEWTNVAGGGVWCRIRCNPKWLIAAP